MRKLPLALPGLLLLALVPLALRAAQDPAPEDRPAPRARIGAPAPAFRLNDQAGRVVAFAPAEEGTWTVLAFFPKAATPG